METGLFSTMNTRLDLNVPKIRYILFIFCFSDLNVLTRPLHDLEF